MEPQISRTRERVVGSVIAIGGLVLTGYGWWLLGEGGEARFISAFAGPFFAITGLALVAVPGFRSERASDPEKGSKGEGLTPRWRIILGVALALALANYILARNGWTPL